MIYLKDYQRPDFIVKHIDLTFDLAFELTLVHSVMQIQKESKKNVPLVLNGEYLNLLEVKLNENILHSIEYELSDKTLTIHNTPDNFILSIKNTINPAKNKALEGLYKADSILCSQNEPEGFRRITYFIDRPDNMSIYTVKMIANKKDFPVLLSNGNLIEQGNLEDGKHYTKWEDPFAKPSYLFAIVAGKLGFVQDSFLSLENKKIDLFIYCDIGDENKCDYAMQSLKNAMKWDEERFNLVYDLDRYMIVATDSFNMGAMENKGLNIFNSAYVLASQNNATDDNYKGIESVIAHEYFHNYTGNKITCQNWFELTLKEGLTVFRDQEFSADMNSKILQRISDVETLRFTQFVEDSSPIAHPIKPKSYEEINNFYTATIYEKGAEVIRMLQTLLGKNGFDKGIELYIKTFNAKAVGTKDFIWAMQKANDYDLTLFSKWYDNVGTPILTINSDYEKNDLIISIEVSQDLYMPFNIGILDNNGCDIVNETIILNGKKNKFIFENIKKDHTLSLNRNFSAPVILNYNYSIDQLIFLVANDTDIFNRYEMMQNLSIRLMLQSFKNNSTTVNQKYIEVFKTILADTTIDNQLKAKLLSLPTLATLMQKSSNMDIQKLDKIRNLFLKSIAATLNKSLQIVYKNLCKEKSFSIDALSMGERALKNLILYFLMHNNDKKIIDSAYKQFLNAKNMTDKLGALRALSKQDTPTYKNALKLFYEEYKTDSLSINKYFSIISSADNPNILNDINNLEKLPEYSLELPNIIRAITGNFTRNYKYFHTKEGYAYVVDKILELDNINPQIASGLAKSFKDYKKLLPQTAQLMKNELQKLLNNQDLSKNVLEIVEKLLID
jgi:aminopeptidase N